ncbi:MAG: DUF4867 family protein [Tenericutes bacterium]|nr:DUF4867 family protein [Mycoplasmatota bacterium]
MIKNLIEKNTQIQVLPVTDKSFNHFGRILNENLFIEAVNYLETTEVPDNGNVYVAHDKYFLNAIKDFSAYDDVFGDMPIQYGYCNGLNSKLNALEYHKSSEINIAVTDLVLMLGKFEDIHHLEYDSSKLVAYYLPKGTAIELHPRVLHFAPCKVNDQGFKCGVILPNLTNVDFCKAKQINCDEDNYLFKTNKWLLAHPENTKAISQGAFEGITGKNIDILY